MDRPGAVAPLRTAAERFLKDYLDGAQRWCVGLSGGPDSLALTAVAAQPILRRTDLFFPVDDAWIVLVDDVLYTGRTVIAPALAGKGAGRMNGLAIAVQIDAFGVIDGFTRDVAQLAQALKAVPLASGTSSILMPGERGFAEAASRRANGIPLPAGTVARLAKLAERFGVGPPPTK